MLDASCSVNYSNQNGIFWATREDIKNGGKGIFILSAIVVYFFMSYFNILRLKKNSFFTSVFYTASCSAYTTNAKVTILPFFILKTSFKNPATFFSFLIIGSWYSEKRDVMKLKIPHANIFERIQQNTITNSWLIKIGSGGFNLFWYIWELWHKALNL